MDMLSLIMLGCIKVILFLIKFHIIEKLKKFGIIEGNIVMEYTFYV